VKGLLTGAPRGGLLFSAGLSCLLGLGLGGCLDVERAQYCNQTAGQIRVVFPRTQKLTTGAERNELASKIDGLLAQLAQNKEGWLPARGELNILSQELKVLASDLRRPGPGDAPLTLGQRRKMSDSLEKSKVAASYFASACR
jgi:hypothetical protein